MADKKKNYFTINDIFGCSAEELYHLKLLSECESEISALMTLLCYVNPNLINNVSKIFFNNQCKKDIWKTVDIPDHTDSLIFFANLVSDNGKLIINCYDTNTNNDNLEWTLLKNAGNLFLATQINKANYLIGGNLTDDEIKINDQFNYWVLVNDEIYEIKLTSPEVIWLYMKHKLISSSDYETAIKFDETHPSEHLFNMLKCSFEYNKIT